MAELPVHGIELEGTRAAHCLEIGELSRKIVYVSIYRTVTGNVLWRGFSFRGCIFYIENVIPLQKDIYST